MLNLISSLMNSIRACSLVIQPSHQESNALPAAHTCFNILDLPLSYATPDIMKERLLTALEYSEGFGLL